MHSKSLRGLVPLVLLLLVSSPLQAQGDIKMQSAAVTHSAGEFILSVSPDILVSRGGPKLAGGFKLQFFISRKISLDADLVASRNYLHMDPGLIGVPLGLLVLGDDETEHSLNEILLSLAGLALSVEHVSYHAPLNSITDLSPYICVLRYRKSQNRTYDPEGDLISNMKDQLCFAAGLQVDRFMGRFLLSPYAEFSVSYKDGNPYFNTGIYLGYSFNRKY